MRIYIETSIPSFYYETRTDERSQEIRRYTRRWWDTRRQGHELVTSNAAVFELERGEHPRKAEKLGLIAGLRAVPLGDDVREAAKVYKKRLVMPDEEMGDAVHFAAASCHGCDVLLTNNTAHLANPSKFEHIRQVNEELGLAVPLLKTPQELIEEEPRDDVSDD